MARAIWTGMLSFGLVNLPVGLFSATEQKDVHFHQFEEGTNQRIRYKRVAEGSDREVPYAKILKGYELDSGDYVMLSQEELESVAPGRSKTIEIRDFVDLSEIDPIYFEKSYYLGPQGPGSGRPYALLRAAMDQAQLVGLSTFVMRSKEYLAAIRPAANVLVMETMYFPDEVRDPLQILDSLRDLPDQVDQRELGVAVSLIEQLATPWDPERYHDSYRGRVLELIESKAKGERVEVAPAAPEETKVVDLMEALRRSVDAARESRGEKGRAGRTGRARAQGGTTEKDRTQKRGPSRKRSEDLSQLSKQDLLDRARELDVSGRSKMSREELEQAIRKAS